VESATTFEVLGGGQKGKLGWKSGVLYIEIAHDIHGNMYILRLVV
jgi:hypothetical protein